MSGFFKPFHSSRDHPSQENGDQSNCPAGSQSSARDSLLKSNTGKDNECNRTPSIRKDDTITLHPSPQEDNTSTSILDRPRNDETIFKEGFFSHGFHGGGGLGDFRSLFGIMDQMLGQFQSGTFEEHFNDSFSDSRSFFDFPTQPPFDAQPLEEERKDTDLDDSSNKEIASLLKKPPGYQEQPRHDSPSSRFHSETVIRIHYPDRVVEERRKYRRDGSGREESEVSTYDSAAAEDETGRGPPRGEAPQDHLFRSFFKGLF